MALGVGVLGMGGALDSHVPDRLWLGPQEEGRLATRTLTVLFTDLAGYTASVGRSDREALRNLVADHERTVAPVLEQHGGRVVKNLGDSFMALFPAATDAVKAGLSLVDTIKGEGGFSIRGAMATGDVEEIDGDAFGEAVNLAARILAKAPANEIWLSEATLACMNQAEIPWESVGQFTLKGFPGECRLFRAVPQGQAWLPQSVTRAVRSGRLVQIRPGDTPGTMPPEPTVLLQGFEPGSTELIGALKSLPVIDPACLWLQTYRIAPSDRHAWTEAGRGLLIAEEAALEDALETTRRPITRGSGTDTIILDVAGTAELDLVMAGLALPSVPMSDVVAGYTYDLIRDGRWMNQSDSAVARVEVAPGEVRIGALVPGISINGQRVGAGASHKLCAGDAVQVQGVNIEYMQLEESGYVGALLSDTTTRVGVASGTEFEIGREPNHPGLALPDRRGQGNIRWCVGARAARARDGGFTLDRALAGRRQASVCIEADGGQVLGLHKTCPTYRLRDGALSRVDSPLPITIDDMIVVGTSVVALRAPQA
jgi:class 3 adenylate cyclase